MYVARDFIFGNQVSTLRIFCPVPRVVCSSISRSYSSLPVFRFRFPVSRSRCPVSSFSFPVSRIPFSHFPFPVPNSHILNVFSSMFFSWSLNFPLQGSRFFSKCFSIKFFMIKHVTLRKKHNTTVPHQYWITFSLAVNRSKITINYTKAYFPKVLSLLFF